MSLRTYIKDPDATLDYHVDWTSELPGTDTISILTVLPDSGITIESSSHNGYVTSFWASGGTVGSAYSVIYRIETSAGRKDDRTITIRVEDK